MKAWLERGDGIALYQNTCLDSSGMGRKQWVSYGSDDAQLEMGYPPQTLPDIGPTINWPYQLVGTCRGSDRRHKKCHKS